MAARVLRPRRVGRGDRRHAHDGRASSSSGCTGWAWATRPSSSSARCSTAEQHPDADRLTVCTVDIGAGEPSTIVCGAPNVAAGQTVAVARPGAIMPDGTKLGEAKLRGVESSGMILAEDEVGIGKDHAGTMVLDDVAAGRARRWPSTCRSPTRCSSSRSRRTGPTHGRLRRGARPARGHRRRRWPRTRRRRTPSRRATTAPRTTRRVEIADPEICLRFTARVFEDVKIGPSPLWLKQRLMAAGQRPISNVVDITNYVMLCVGQPLHAFDLDEVRGRQIVVRRAARGRDDDHARRRGAHLRPPRWRSSATPRARAGSPGVMGGLISEVSDKTTRVADGGGHLGGPEHHADLEGARAAHRGVARASRSSCTPSWRWPRSGWRRG